MHKRTDAGWIGWVFGALVLALIDQVTKYWIQASLQPGEHVEVLPFFDLVLAFNRGAAFSFLADEAGWQRIFFIAVAAIASAVILYLLRKHRLEPRFCCALMLILGGALGNLWDRVYLGHVVDFLLFHAYGRAFPAFNFADTAITIGAALLIFDSFFNARRSVPGEVRS